MLRTAGTGYPHCTSTCPFLLYLVQLWYTIGRGQERETEAGLVVEVRLGLGCQALLGVNALDVYYPHIHKSAPTAFQRTTPTQRTLL